MNLKNISSKVIAIIFFLSFANAFFLAGEDKHERSGKFLKDNNFENKPPKESHTASLNWTDLENNTDSSKKIIWENYNEPNIDFYETYESQKMPNIRNRKKGGINSLNRSIVFNNKSVGPDISWIVPPGFSWNKKFKFDIYSRGHNTRIPEPKNRKFFGWNDGDAVGLFSYQFLHRPQTSFGINIGIRSIYQGDQAAGGTTSIGEGVSAGFRWDYALSNNSGLAFGAEQLIHFDDTTDTGRNIYLTASKAWWSVKDTGIESFPLYTATAGFGTGRMAVGSIKGLCTNSLGGSGTEFVQRPLCWAPVFSVASVWNEKLSTFFEYNSRFFLLGSSLAPLQNIPIRGTFALILSDHVDNYKLHDGSELNWVFNLSLGF
tara:strand:- start:93 stop:1217 length:1125 start_codon:yes stop_codon:yes gene_type:complete